MGFACRASDTKQLNKQCGTPSYVAPEILKNNPANFKSDIFSIGSLLFNLLSGEPLFLGSSIEDVLWKNLYQSPLTIVD